MTSNKSERINDDIWAQHLRWLELVSNECKSNQLKRRRAKAGNTANSQRSVEK